MKRFIRVAVKLIFLPFMLVAFVIWGLMGLVFTAKNWAWEAGEREKAINKEVWRDLTFGLFKDFWK